MKIAILAPYSRPFDEGDNEGSGMNDFIRDSTEFMHEAGHEVTIFIRKSRSWDKIYENKNGLQIYTVQAGPQKELKRTEAYNACREADFPLEKLKETEVIIAHYWISEAWIRKIRKKFTGKIIYFAHSLGMRPEKEKIVLEQVSAEMFLVQTVIWCANSSEEKSLLEKYYGLEDVEILYPGVKEIPYSSKYPLNSNQKEYILFVGRKNKAKGFDFFVRLAKENPQYQFKAIGREEDYPMEEVANLEMLPYCSKDQLYSYIKNSLLVVHPSRYEHCGLVPLLAVYLEIPVLASATGIAKDIFIDNSVGLVHEPNNFEELKKTFKKFIENFYYNETASEKIRNQFTWNSFVSHLEKIILKERIIYKGNIMTLRTIPKIFNEKLLDYEQVELIGSVHVLPITEDGKILLIKERRLEHPTEYKLRILSGMIDNNEDYLKAAERELREETGIRAKRFELFMQISENNAVKDSRYYILAHDLSKEKMVQGDSSEDISGMFPVTIKELFRMALNGHFGTSRSIIAITKLYYHLKNDQRV